MPTRKKSSNDVLAYAIFCGRFARLYPLHTITLLAVVVIWTGIVVINRLTGMALGDAFNCRAVELFETLTLAHFIFGGAPCFNAPSWSIGVEWWCGIALFVLMLPLRAVLKSYLHVRGNLLSQRRLPLQVSTS
jgi:peptidoglycan/LPS O-acetylase OafA/YrhL